MESGHELVVGEEINKGSECEARAEVEDGAERDRYGQRRQRAPVDHKQHQREA